MKWRQFLQDWRRVRSFSGGKDVQALQRIAREIQAAVGEQPDLGLSDGPLALTEDQIRRWTRNWLSNILFTSPRASLLKVGNLIESVSAEYLADGQVVRRRTRSRRTAAAIVAGDLQLALARRHGPEAEDFVQRNHRIDGAHEAHRYDVVVANGRVYFGAQALSFESPDESELLRDVRVTAWDVSDVFGHAPNLPLAVVALPPKRASEAFELGRRVIGELGAAFLTEDEFPDWAQDFAKTVPVEATGSLAAASAAGQRPSEGSGNGSS